MKKRFLSILMCVAVFFSIFSFSGCGLTSKEISTDYAFEKLEEVDNNGISRREKLLSNYNLYSYIEFNINEYSPEGKLTKHEKIYLHNIYASDKIDLVLYREIDNKSTGLISYELLEETRDTCKYYASYKKDNNVIRLPAVLKEKIVFQNEVQKVFNLFYGSSEILPAYVDQIITAMKCTLSTDPNKLQSIEITFEGTYNGAPAINDISFNYATNKIHFIRNYDEQMNLLREIEFTYPGNLVTDPVVIAKDIFDMHNHIDGNSDLICESCGTYLKGGWVGNIATLPEAVDGVLKISSENELAALSKAVADGESFRGVTIELTNNLNMGLIEWTPIGCGGKEFQGIFDGKGYTIFNLRAKSAEYAGLFGAIGWEATVKNINIKNIIVTGHHYVGSIAGWVQSCDANHRVTVTNCNVENAVVICSYKDEDLSGDKCGGFVGYLVRSDLSYCTGKNILISAARDAGKAIGCMNISSQKQSTYTEITTTENVLVFDNNGVLDPSTSDNLRNEAVGRIV